MRTVDFVQPDPIPEPSSHRHQVRSAHFNDQSLYTYSNPGTHWWGYA